MKRQAESDSYVSTPSEPQIRIPSLPMAQIPNEPVDIILPIKKAIKGDWVIILGANLDASVRSKIRRILLYSKVRREVLENTPRAPNCPCILSAIQMMLSRFLGWQCHYARRNTHNPRLSIFSHVHPVVRVTYQINLVARARLYPMIEARLPIKSACS